MTDFSFNSRWTHSDFTIGNLYTVVGAHGFYNNAALTTLDKSFGLLVSGDFIVFLGATGENQAGVTTWQTLTRFGIGWIVAPICEPVL